jgi:hypothetical protein
MALFEEFEDIDQLVHECIATLPLEEAAPAKRVHGARGKTTRGSKKVREREATQQRRPAAAGQGRR